MVNTVNTTPTTTVVTEKMIKGFPACVDVQLIYIGSGLYPGKELEEGGDSNE